MLWIAFKLYFYQVHWQLFGLISKVFSSCELLSNCIFIRFIDNFRSFAVIRSFVVNCFQIVFLSGSLTTVWIKSIGKFALWIAFKLYFYQVHWQHSAISLIDTNRCELLSNCIFIRFIDNFYSEGFRPSELWIAFKLYFYQVHWQLADHLQLSELVVNCFQIVFLSGSLTTNKIITNNPPKLWIAFKLYFYQVHWQHRHRCKLV